MKLHQLAVAAAFLAPLASHAGFPDTVTSGARNVVLVPGAYVDVSGLRQLHDQLWLKGYKITVAPQPHTSLDEDVAAVRRAIDEQDGPVVLVGQDVGGTAISIAGTDARVKALVYIAALQPERGESSGQLLASRPQLHEATRSTRDGRISLDPAQFAAVYAGDLPPNRTNFLQVSQTRIAKAVLDAPASAAAWRDKPAYAIVATEDRLVNPELQRWMYRRSGAKVTEIKGSHAVAISRPEEVARVVIGAALDVR